MAGSNANDQSGEHCSGVTPLHDAAANGHIEVVKLLLAHGASINLKDNNVSLLSLSGIVLNTKVISQKF